VSPSRKTKESGAGHPLLKMGTDNEVNEISRRCFLCGVAATSAATALGSTIDAVPQDEPRAVSDPSIAHGKVEFASGDDRIDGYLARPKREGRFHPAVVIPGSWIIEPYIPETVAKLAQAGYVALAVNVFHFFPKVSNYDEADRVPWETTQELVRKFYRDERVWQDVEAGIRYLEAQDFTRPGATGLLGFCGGGTSALLSAAQTKRSLAVVAFYAPLALKIPDRKTPLEVVNQIRVPVQGHYGKRDQGIPLSDVARFEQELKKQRTETEIYQYDVGHGFFAYNREDSYQPAAARLAWARSLAFFKRHLT
jgi:carboxymethylenebutenolidase